MRDSVASYKSSPANRQTSQNIGEKDKQIENLSRTLKKKIEEVLRAEDLNRDLAQKMRKLQEDSDLTTKIAREEYNNLQREFERTENLKNSLAEEITELQEELDRLKSRANQLELENRALREDSQKVTRLLARTASHIPLGKDICSGACDAKYNRRENGNC